MRVHKLYVRPRQQRIVRSRRRQLLDRLPWRCELYLSSCSDRWSIDGGACNSVPRPHPSRPHPSPQAQRRREELERQRQEIAQAEAEAEAAQVRTSKARLPRCGVQRLMGVNGVRVRGRMAQAAADQEARRREQAEAEAKVRWISRPCAGPACHSPAGNAQAKAEAEAAAGAAAAQGGDSEANGAAASTTDSASGQPSKPVDA